MFWGRNPGSTHRTGENVSSNSELQASSLPPPTHTSQFAPSAQGVLVVPVDLNVERTGTRELLGKEGNSLRSEGRSGVWAVPVQPLLGFISGPPSAALLALGLTGLAGPPAGSVAWPATRVGG